MLELSHTDPLTSLNNRRSMMDSLDKEFERSTRTQSPLSLLMLDIDHFKKINDSFGHQQGDTVLQALASLLKEHLLAGPHLGARSGDRAPSHIRSGILST